MPKIKIIYIIDTMGLGGAQTMLLELLNNLDKEKFDPQVVTIIEKGVFADEVIKMGIRHTHIQKRGKLSWGLFLDLIKFFRLEKPDIVHTQLFGGDTWGRISAYLAKVPVIITTEQNINVDEGWIKKRVKTIISWITDKVVAITNGVKEYSISADKINPKKIILIHNAIDLAKFPFRGIKPIDLQNINAGVIARLTEQKGHSYFIQAMPQIIAKYPGFKVRFVGSGELEDSLKQEVEQLKLNKYIEFAGFKRNIPEILSQIDLFILPSIWEGQGVAVVEAQAVGVPVLISNVPGMSELVDNAKTGLLFEPGSPDSIFEAVDKILSNPGLAEKMVTNARQQAEKKFGIGVMVGKYERLYLGLVK